MIQNHPEPIAEATQTTTSTARVTHPGPLARSGRRGPGGRGGRPAVGTDLDAAHIRSAAVRVRRQPLGGLDGGRATSRIHTRVRALRNAARLVGVGDLDKFPSLKWSVKGPIISHPHLKMGWSVCIFVLIACYAVLTTPHLSHRRTILELSQKRVPGLRKLRGHEVAEGVLGSSP